MHETKYVQTNFRLPLSVCGWKHKGPKDYSETNENLPFRWLHASQKLVKPATPLLSTSDGVQADDIGV